MKIVSSLLSACKERISRSALEGGRVERCAMKGVSYHFVKDECSEVFGVGGDGFWAYSFLFWYFREGAG